MPRRRSPAEQTTLAPGSESLPPCIRVTECGVVLDISVSPNAKRSEVIGLHDGALRLRLAAQPVDGQANATLLRWLSEELGVARQQIELLRGDTARRKQVQIKHSAEKVLAWLSGKLKADMQSPAERREQGK